MATTVFDKPLDKSVGTLSSLTTTEKTNLVGAINEVKGAITELYVTDIQPTSNSDGLVNLSNNLSGHIPSTVNVFNLICKTSGFICSNPVLWSNGNWYTTIINATTLEIAKSQYVTIRVAINK